MSKWTKVACIISSILVIILDILVIFIGIFAGIIGLIIAVVSIVHYGGIMNGVDIILEMLNWFIGTPIIICVLLLIYSILNILIFKLNKIKKYKEASAIILAECIFIFILACATVVISTIINDITLIVMSVIIIPFAAIMMLISIIGLMRITIKSGELKRYVQ